MSTNSTPLRVGITGNMGAGKTYVCKIFENLGIPIYNADYEAKKLMITKPDLIESITQLLGNEAYTSDGNLNKPYISKQVFNDKSLLERLNKLVHPAVRQHSLEWSNSFTNKPYTIQEAALFIESGNYKSLDKMILVSAPLELRVERVLKRDKTNREAVLARMNAQMPESEKKKYCDFIIENKEDSDVSAQVEYIHQQLINHNIKSL